MWQVLYKYYDKPFINKPAFVNFGPELIGKIYHTDTTWFYWFVCTIVAQAHILLMTIHILT